MLVQVQSTADDAPAENAGVFFVASERLEEYHRHMLIDLHSDTIYALWDDPTKGSLVSSSLSIDRNKLYGGKLWR